MVQVIVVQLGHWKVLRKEGGKCLEGRKVEGGSFVSFIAACVAFMGGLAVGVCICH
jgi:hypothetical protein